jgi:hypothetical protein
VSRTRGAAVAQAGQEPPHLAAALGVEARRGLVEHHQLRAAHQGARQVDPAGLAAGQGAHAHVGALLEREQREHVVDRARGREGRAPLAQRLADRQVTREAAPLEQDPGAAAQDGAVGDRIEPEHADLTVRRRGQPLDHLEDRRLPRAVGAEQSGGRPALHVEVHPADGLERGGTVPVGPTQSAHPHRGG